MNMKRSRISRLALTFAAMAAGLASRKTADMLLDIVNAYLGDVLWALVFCFLIECSQLYHAPWIDHMRAAPLGGLILGYGFLWSDLLAYVLGVSAGAAGEMLFRKRKRQL
ncbi:DUF2809 domain-containing protein [Bacillus haynesii]|uniref:ribosomal maturation YjgA family protein n=1 Tax=Bacillus haynesii TaxID=1925021 RepID=UPI002282BDC5|nr:DUF2809 domain-containing protein [Bacillus haynesii]MCY9213529.1 DUF2809 domain-containing protein [Bacillus haynesii]